MQGLVGLGMPEFNSVAHHCYTASIQFNSQRST